MPRSAIIVFISVHPWFAALPCAADGRRTAVTAGVECRASRGLRMRASGVVGLLAVPILGRASQPGNRMRSLRLEAILAAVLLAVLPDDLLGRHPLVVDAPLILEIAIVLRQRRHRHEIRVGRGEIDLLR